MKKCEMMDFRGPCDCVLKTQSPTEAEDSDPTSRDIVHGGPITAECSRDSLPAGQQFRLRDQRLSSSRL